MAGAFGFEADKYRVSIAVGERVLLPAVRAAAKDTLLIADGFSCRTQIEETTDRHALHLAQVLKMGLDHGPRGPAAISRNSATSRSRPFRPNWFRLPF